MANQFLLLGLSLFAYITVVQCAYCYTSYGRRSCTYGCCYDSGTTSCCSPSSGSIVGSSIGTLVGIAILVAIIVLCCCRRHRQRGLAGQVFTSPGVTTSTTTVTGGYQTGMMQYPVQTPAAPGTYPGYGVGYGSGAAPGYGQPQQMGYINSAYPQQTSPQTYPQPMSPPTAPQQQQQHQQFAPPPYTAAPNSEYEELKFDKPPPY